MATKTIDQISDFGEAVVKVECSTKPSGASEYEEVNELTIDFSGCTLSQVKAYAVKALVINWQGSWRRAYTGKNGSRDKAANLSRTVKVLDVVQKIRVRLTPAEQAAKIAEGKSPEQLAEQIAELERQMNKLEG